MSGWLCLLVINISPKNGLVADRITLCASFCWWPSLTRVTSQNFFMLDPNIVDLNTQVRWGYVQLELITPLYQHSVRVRVPITPFVSVNTMSRFPYKINNCYKVAIPDSSHIYEWMSVLVGLVDLWTCSWQDVLICFFLLVTFTDQSNITKVNPVTKHRCF